MESPADYLDSPMDGDDVAYPCKGCGDVGRLKEGSLRVDTDREFLDS
jgi:Rho-type GTPase-activating protein 1/2